MIDLQQTPLFSSRQYSEYTWRLIEAGNPSDLLRVAAGADFSLCHIGVAGCQARIGESARRRGRLAQNGKNRSNDKYDDSPHSDGHGIAEANMCN